MQMQYVSTGDLVKRWKYTRQGVNVLAKKPEFPPPAFKINDGRLPVWELAAIEEYERDRPELHSEGAKQQKIKGFFLAIQKGTKNEGGLPDGNTPKKPVGSTEITPLEDWLNQPAQPTGKGKR